MSRPIFAIYPPKSYSRALTNPLYLHRPSLINTLSVQAQSDVAAEHALTLYRDVIRRLLRVTEGYECQEAEGTFMLAFHDPVKAVQFCLMVSSKPPRTTNTTCGEGFFKEAALAQHAISSVRE